MFWFYFSSIHFARLLLWNKGGVLLKDLSQRQDMRVLVALTVNGRDKVLKGTAVQRESSGPLALLVLLNSLQHDLLLKRRKLASLNVNCHNSIANACMRSHA